MCARSEHPARSLPRSWLQATGSRSWLALKYQHAALQGQIWLVSHWLYISKANTSGPPCDESETVQVLWYYRGACLAARDLGCALVFTGLFYLRSLESQSVYSRTVQHSSAAMVAYYADLRLDGARLVESSFTCGWLVLCLRLSCSKQQFGRRYACRALLFG